MNNPKKRNSPSVNPDSYLSKLRVRWDSRLKTLVLFFSRDSFYCTEVKGSQQGKFLGVMLDSVMEWKYLVDYLNSKLSKTLRNRLFLGDVYSVQIIGVFYISLVHIIHWIMIIIRIMQFHAREEYINLTLINKNLEKLFRIL